MSHPPRRSMAARHRGFTVVGGPRRRAPEPEAPTLPHGRIDRLEIGEEDAREAASTILQTLVDEQFKGNREEASVALQGALEGIQAAVEAAGPMGVLALHAVIAAEQKRMPEGLRPRMIVAGAVLADLFSREVPR